MANPTCAPHNRNAAAGANSWLRREFSKSIRRRSCTIRRDGGTPAVLKLSTTCRSRGALNASRSNRAKTPASSARSWAGASTPARIVRTGRRTARENRTSPTTTSAKGNGPDVSQRPGSQRDDRERGEDCGDDLRPASVHQRRRPAPARQQIGLPPGTELVAEQRQVFPEIEQGLQLADGLLSGVQVGCRGRGQQPPRQGFFPRSDAGGRQQLEQRPAAEEVEVRSVRMIRDQKPLARLARARPRVGDTSDACLVERSRTARP